MQSVLQCTASMYAVPCSWALWKSPGLGRRTRNPEDKREIYTHSHQGLMQNLIGRVSNKGAAERALRLWPQYNSKAVTSYDSQAKELEITFGSSAHSPPCQAAEHDQATLFPCFSQPRFLSSRGDTNHSLQAFCNSIQPVPALLPQLLQLSLQAGLSHLHLCDHLCSTDSCNSLLGPTLTKAHCASRMFAPQHQPAQTVHLVLLWSTEGCESSQF